MNRLKKIGNHVSQFVHEEVEKDVIDNERTLRRNSSDSYLIARQLTMDTTLSPTNENMLLLMKYIDGGKFSDLGKSKDNWDKWVSRTREIFKVAKKGKMKMKRLIRKADAISLDANLALDAQDVLSKLQSENGKFSMDNLLPDTAANRNSIWGLVDDTGNYVLEIYSFKDDLNAIVVAPIVDGVVNTNYDIGTKVGTRSSVKNDIVASGYNMSNGTKLTFANQYTSIPEPEEVTDDQNTAM